MLDLSFNAFKVNIIGDMLRKVIQMHLASYMRRQSPPGYHDVLIPDYDFGAKRPVMDHGYLSALHEPRLTLIRSRSLTVLGPRGVECDNGQLLEADAIILANGFKTQGFLAPVRVIGEEGQELHQVWNQNGNFPSAYMG
jgi:cation diffusion facilitator CzcD-associated flavoprotein CzcO